MTDGGTLRCVAGLIAGTIAADAPVVPISAQLKYNIDAVCEYLIKKIPVPVRCAACVLSCNCRSAFEVHRSPILQSIGKAKRSKI